MLRQIASLRQLPLRSPAGGLQAALRPCGTLARGVTLWMRLQPPAVRSVGGSTTTNVYQSSIVRQSTYLFVAAPGVQMDPSRPASAVRTLLKIVTRESTLRLMQPFYSGMVRRVLREEQQDYRSRPNKAISLIWSLFGRENAFQTLTRFYLSAVGRMGTGYYSALNTANSLYLASGVILQSRTYQKYARQVWQTALLKEQAVSRYGLREAAASAAGYLHRLPMTRREELEREAVRKLTDVQRESVPALPAVPVGPRFTDEEMRFLVKNVSQELERRMRFEALRRGRG